MTETHTWVHNPQTGGYWQCPEGLLADLLAGGSWELCDAPAEPNPATAEHAAWREAQAAQESPKPKTTTRAATRGESQES